MDEVENVGNAENVENAKRLWYVLRAIGGKEKKAKEYIEIEVKKRGLESKLSRVLVPLKKELRDRQTSRGEGKKKVPVVTPIYPGYVFVEAILTPKVQRALLDIPNIINFVGIKVKSGGAVDHDKKGRQQQLIITPMLPAEANRLLGSVDKIQEQEEQVVATLFSVGDAVKVVDGAFNGWNGVVEELNEEKKTMKVTVKIFNRDTPMELSFMQVEKVC
ncbi:MAG: transcription termination/antitermination factor NusG [Prevotellaceae bacterium]|jgi:transcriptional antiterminator NusG|nr:transcription termination/antitermination factor NusG [Prevotellaceae bacterium]